MSTINLKTPLLAILALICCISFSCKSSSYTETKQSDEASRDTISQTDLTETKEDLLTVDYKQFYDQLAPKGEWIEVTANDLKSEAPTSAGEENDELNQILKERSSTFQKVTIGQLFGVSDAVAADINVGTFFVWRPDPSMAVSISAGVPVVENEPAVVVAPPVVVAPAMYRPYTNGQWIASDEGWYFKAPTPEEEIVHHYGRWSYSPTMGWVWVPGRVRSPAWVDWREDDNSIAWTPIPPDVFVVNNVIEPVPVYEDNYVVVEKRYFVEPVVTQYVYVDKIKVKEMRKLHGLYVRDRVLYNRGPEFVEIERVTGKPITPFKVVTVNNDFRNTWIENNNINTFAPVFYKVKGNKNKNIAVTQPEKFNKFEEVWNRENKSAGERNKIENIGKDKAADNNSKQLGKELKEHKENGRKFMDDSEMKYGKKNNERKEKAPKNDNGNVNKERKEKPNKENGRKEVNKERKENPKKESKPNKERKEVKAPVERSKDNPKKDNPHRDNPHKESPKDNPHGNPKKDKK